MDQLIDSHLTTEITAAVPCIITGWVGVFKCTQTDTQAAAVDTRNIVFVLGYLDYRVN